MNSVYIILYDNGQDYEDHSSWPVLTVSTKERAEQIVNEVNKWARETNEQMPALYEMPMDATESDYDKLEASERVRHEWVEKVDAPYGIQDFVGLMMDYDSFYKPHLSIVEVPFIES